MGFWTTLKQGQKYLDTWPNEPKLAMIFPENRVIKSTRFAMRVMPFLAVFAVCWQWLYGTLDWVGIAACVLTVLVALGIPLQGLYWLGKRAQTPLNQASMAAVLQILQALAKAQIHKTLPNEANHQDLAEVLKLAKTHLPASFWSDL